MGNPVMPASRVVIALAGVSGAHELDGVAGRIAKRDQRADVPLGALVAGPGAHRLAGALELRRRLVERFGGACLECHGVVLRLAFEIHEGVIPCVGAEIHRATLAIGHFETDDLGSEARRLLEVADTDATIPNVLQVDHVRFLPRLHTKIHVPKPVVGVELHGAGARSTRSRCDFDPPSHELSGSSCPGRKKSISRRE